MGNSYMEMGSTPAIIRKIHVQIIGGCHFISARMMIVTKEGQVLVRMLSKGNVYVCGKATAKAIVEGVWLSLGKLKVKLSCDLSLLHQGL